MGFNDKSFGGDDMKRGQLFSLLMGMIIVFFSMPIDVVKGAGEPTVPTTAEAYANAPNGMKLDKFVDIPSGYTYTQNNKEYTFTSSGSLLTDYSTNIIQLITTSKTKAKQMGSFWGTVKDDNGIRTYNYFDLTKDQELSVWVYNGRSDTAGQAIDGFAFVLQNDELGEQAISRIGGLPTAGQTLGVWGTAAGGGIKNSVALEFDRYPNVSSAENYDNLWTIPVGEGVTYSRNIKEKHISWNYPGEADSYIGNNILKHRKTPSQVTNYLPMSGYDGAYAPAFGKYNPQDAWRHLLINYKTADKGESDGTLTYKFNDKYPDGTNKLSGMIQSGQLKIDTTKFKSQDKKVRWGFTAATGSSLSGIQDVAFVVDKMPAVADVKTTVDAHDLTTDKRSSDLETTTNNQGLTVYKPLDTFDGDKIQFEYNLQYIEGLSETGGVKTQVALPEHIDYSGDDAGIIGSIVYFDADGKETKRDNINKSQIEDVKVTVPGKDSASASVTKTLDGLKLNVDSLKDPKSKVQILINGTAQAEASDVAMLTNVEAEHTSYRSENFTGDVISPELTISNDPLVIERTSEVNQTVDAGKTVKFEGNVEHAKQSQFDGSDLVATTKIYDANNNLVRTDKKNVSVLLGSLKGTFSLPTETTDLAPGQTYTAQVDLRDVTGRVSNELNYNFKIQEAKLTLNLGSGNGSRLERVNDTFINYEAYYKSTSGNTAGKLKDMLIHYRIDGSSWEEEAITDKQITTDKIFKKYIDGDQLSNGRHTIDLYLNDGTQDSNTVSYEFVLVDRVLQLTPEKREITVNNNDPVNLKWQVSVDKDAELTTPVIESKLEKAQIRNLDQPDMQNFEDISIGQYMGYPIHEVKPQFDFDLKPFKYGGTGGQKYLKEGRNEIKLSVSQVIQGQNYISAEEIVVINVPKLTLQIESLQPDYYTTSKTALLVLGMKYKYLEDDSYTTELEKLPTSLVAYVSYGDNEDIQFSTTTGGNNEKREFELRGSFYNWNGVLKPDNTYQMSAAFTDPYGRSSNDVMFNYHLVKEK